MLVSDSVSVSAILYHWIYISLKTLQRRPTVILDVVGFLVVNLGWLRIDVNIFCSLVYVAISLVKLVNGSNVKQSNNGINPFFNFLKLGLNWNILDIRCLEV